MNCEADPPGQNRWSVVRPTEIQDELGTFKNWCLCGGWSLDWLLTRRTRSHGDIDIGVFRTELGACLRELDPKRVFLCDPPGEFMGWVGGTISERVHDIWVTNRERSAWAIQIMIYDDHGDDVTYRRDPGLRWRKRDHSVRLRGMNVLNPMVTLLFKAHGRELRDQDRADIALLIGESARRFAE